MSHSKSSFDRIIDFQSLNKNKKSELKEDLRRSDRLSGDLISGLRGWKVMTQRKTLHKQRGASSEVQLESWKTRRSVNGQIRKASVSFLQNELFGRMSNQTEEGHGTVHYKAKPDWSKPANDVFLK
jgi:hypothetical protein